MALAKRLSKHGAQECLKLHEAQKKSIEPAKAAAHKSVIVEKQKSFYPPKRAEAISL